MADSGRTYTSVLFGEGMVEVSFVEQRHISDRGRRIQTVQMNVRGLEDNVAEVLDSLHDLTTRYEISERNPPDTIPYRP